MKARHITESFLCELKQGVFKPIVDFVRVDPSLDLELRGNTVLIYYRGGKILSITEPKDTDSCVTNGDLYLGALDPKYFKNKSGIRTCVMPSIRSIDMYFAEAKHIIDLYESTVRRHLGEKEIQQRVVAENNNSVNADQTEFFIADMEWGDSSGYSRGYKGRADIVAFYWGHNEHRSKKLKMFLIEVKQGYNAIKTNNPNTSKESPGLLKHYHDYESFCKDSDAVSSTKLDMLEVLRQKTELGLVFGLDNLFKKETGGKLSAKRVKIEDNVEFVFLLANYLHFSDQLQNELKHIKEGCKFFCSSFMGYGLYQRYIVSKHTIERYPSIFITE